LNVGFANQVLYKNSVNATTGSNSLRFTSVGLGINKTASTPSYPLDVVGDIYLTGDIFLASDFALGNGITYGLNGNGTDLAIRLPNVSTADFSITKYNGISASPNWPRIAGFSTTRIDLDTETSINSNLRVTGITTIRPLTNSFVIMGSGGGNIELIEGGGGYINFKKGTKQDYNARIDNFTTNAITISSSNGAGNLRVQNDIIAFISDIRLKTNIVTIENALDKVCKLHGFTYNFNEKAEKIGWDVTQRHVGVSAQDVKEVVPEAIRKAPISDITETDYMTVQYDKLVPLLIEAIKELKDEIDQLKRG
jgi:hypothetical protein